MLVSLQHESSPGVDSQESDEAKVEQDSMPEAMHEPSSVDASTDAQDERKEEQGAMQLDAHEQRPANATADAQGTQTTHGTQYMPNATAEEQGTQTDVRTYHPRSYNLYKCIAHHTLTIRLYLPFNTPHHTNRSIAV